MDQTKFSPRVKSKNIRHCSVPSCTSKANKDLDVIFHGFPLACKRFVYEHNYFGKLEKKDLLQVWKKRLEIKNVTKYMTVCSLHFSKDDYILPDIPSKRRYLKRIAVPSSNLPASGENVELHKSKRTRLMKRNDKKQQNLEDKIIEDTKSPELMADDIQEFNISEEHDDEVIAADSQDIPNTLMKQDVGVQIETDLCKPRFIDLLTSDSVVSTLTGIETLENLNNIVSMVSETFGDALQHPNSKMSVREKIVLTYVKLKQNLSYSCIAALFQSYTPRHCQRIFHDMIKMLSECFKSFIQWASRDVISKNLPKCFKDFEDVRVVLDCTEIYTQHPKNLCCQVLTYSNYKKSQTIKFMTGVTPAGVLSFISRGYGGRISDKAIFENSDITKLLESGDGIMVDRGFRIDEICQKNGWACYQPPFLKDKAQFSKEEAILASKIAKARVHIERVNQRIKVFKIISDKMPCNLIPSVEDIFRVICVTVNLSSPVIKDDKFMTN